LRERQQKGIMKTYRLRKSIWLVQSRAKVFEFFSNPRNLDRLTPAWLKFAILTPATSQLKQGALLDYRLRIRGMPIRWQSEIAVWEPPHRFVDRQTKGPYSLWVHEHTFKECDNGTLVGDNVEYAVPGGTIVQKFMVAPDLKRIFEYRHQILEELFNPAKITPSERTGT
jgi:ligand-binding SRPBCC domain-containing protein